MLIVDINQRECQVNLYYNSLTIKDVTNNKSENKG
jgi:hypothetical protein